MNVQLPDGSIFPKEVPRPSRRWAQRRFANIVYWNQASRGGHFAAWEQPGLFVSRSPSPSATWPRCPSAAGSGWCTWCFVPDVARFDHDQRVQAQSVTGDSAVIEVSRHDKARQRITTQVITLDAQGMQLRPVVIRYSWPTELDLMADQAGLRLAERYADWDRRPFTSGSSSHVSVYRRGLKSACRTQIRPGCETGPAMSAARRSR